MTREPAASVHLGRDGEGFFISFVDAQRKYHIAGINADQLLLLAMQAVTIIGTDLRHEVRAHETGNR